MVSEAQKAAARRFAERQKELRHARGLLPRGRPPRATQADLYLATRSDDPSIIKVGRSDDPARRCAGLQTGHCFEVKPLATWHGAGHFERRVHLLLAAHRIPGPGKEWFRVSPMEAYAAIAMAMLEEPEEGPKEEPEESGGEDSEMAMDE